MTSLEPAGRPWWEVRHPVAPSVLPLVSAAWEYFRTNREWPVADDFARKIATMGFIPSKDLKSSEFGAPQGQPPRTAPSMNALLHLGDVRALLGPLPKVLREACRAYVARPNFEGQVPSTELSSSTMREWWKSPEADLAIALLRQMPGHPLPFGRSTSEEAWYSPGIEVLRFEKVTALEEVFCRRVHPRRSNGEPLSEAHEALTRAVFADASKRYAWPMAVPFAVENRATLGYVPDLVDDLEGDYIASHFDSRSCGQIQLRSAAIALLGAKVETMALRIVHAAAAIWPKLRSDCRVTLAELARHVGEAREAIAPVMLMFDLEPWMGSFTATGPLDDWGFKLLDKVLEYREAATWTDYFAVAHPESGGTVPRLSIAAPFGFEGRADPETMGQPSPGAPAVHCRLLIEALHPRVVAAAAKLFADRHFAEAVLAAFKAVEIRVRELSGITDHGEPLMGRAFRDTNPPINVAVEQGESGQSEQRGFRFLFMGAMAGIRNPKAHEFVQQTDPHRTLEHLAFASLLLHRLDAATVSLDATEGVTPKA